MQSFPYIQHLSLKSDPVRDEHIYPFNVASLRNLKSIEFDQPVTFIIGENGSGKSTLVEAIAVAQASYTSIIHKHHTQAS